MHKLNPRKNEFVALTAFMVSLVALSIDAMLPALSEIGTDLAVAQPHDTQLVVSMLFLGLAFGQLLYGPLSDSFGRKPAIYLGLVLFMAGCLMSMFASSFAVMLAGRILQGFGAAGPRVVSIALVRDQYEGRAMARILSFVMAVFILVPVLAPFLGQAVLWVGSWRWIFTAFLAIAVICLLWFYLRQPETLPPDKRQPFRLRRIAGAVLEVCRSRTSLGHTIAAGLIFGSFVGYLNSAQQILQIDYGLGDAFPVYFGVLALAIGGASLTNAHLVLRLGMEPLANASMLVVAALSLAYLPVVLLLNGQPPLWTLMAYLMLSFFFIGILFGNLNALAMESIGHIAGVGATVVGFLSTLLSVVFGTAIGQAYDGTVLPLVSGIRLAWLGSLWCDEMGATARPSGTVGAVK